MGVGELDRPTLPCGMEMRDHEKEIAHRIERPMEQPERKRIVTRNQGDQHVPTRVDPFCPRRTYRSGTRPTALFINHFPCVIGRGDHCDEPIDNLMISRRHCVFSLRDDQVWVEDLGSRNGTRLNGDRLTSAQPVAEGDALQLAPLAFQILFQKASIPPVTPRRTKPRTARRPDEVLIAQDGADA